MNIITVPHPTLRQKAQPVTEVTPEVKSFVKELQKTLKKTRNPKGVGLAAPQVDTLWQIFLSRADSSDITVFINPQITKHSAHLTLGPDDKNEPRLEGCLSIPQLYGAVPRWEWIDIEYQVIEGDTLVPRAERLEAFAARVAQHEFDHLQGVLFIDYSLQYDLPVYLENPDTKKAEEVERSFLEML